MTRTLAALLHFGNVDFSDDGSSADGCLVKPECEPALAKARDLLGFDPDQFDKVLRFRRLVVGAEVTMRPLKAVEVGGSCEKVQLLFLSRAHTACVRSCEAHSAVQATQT